MTLIILIKIFFDIVSRYNIKLDPENSDFEYMANKLNEYVKNEKQKDSSYKNYRENIFATIQPKKNEYQNFGILQTIDILSVLYDLKDIGFNGIIENKPIFAFGSSHGAYITNLLMKFAPNTFDAILENSAYVKPPLMYIVGQEYNSKCAESFSYYKDSVFIHAFTLTHWTLQKDSPNYFNDSALEIRNLLNKNQLNQFFNYKSKTKVISYHSIHDNIALYKEKEDYINYLKTNNIDVDFIKIYNEKQIDGKFIKNIGHSMGMSNKEFLKNYIPTLLEKYNNSTKTDLCTNSCIKYNTSENYTYILNFLEDKLDFKIKKPKLK